MPWSCIQPADLTNAKPTEAVAPAAVPAIVQADSEPVQTAVAEDKIEPVVQTQSDSETATPPIPIAKETVVEENKADEQAVAAAPTTTAGSSPKKVSLRPIQKAKASRVADHINSTGKEGHLCSNFWNLWHVFP